MEGAKPEGKDRKLIQSPLSFIKQLRRSILGDNPETEELARFEFSTAGKALAVVSAFFELQKDDYPKPIGELYANQSDDLKDPRIVFYVGRQYLIDVHSDGRIELDPTHSGMDDFLLYEADDAKFGVSIDAKTGEVTSLEEGNPKISQKSQDRINRMLDITYKYYFLFRIDDLEKFPIKDIEAVRKVPI